MATTVDKNFGRRMRREIARRLRENFESFQNQEVVQAPAGDYTITVGNESTQYYDKLKEINNRKSCDVCKGKGRILLLQFEEPCTKCDGSGQI